MGIYKGTYDLVDIIERRRGNPRKSLHPSPLPRCEIPNYRVVLEVPHYATEATVGDEEYFALSLVSLESDCKRMRLNLSYESIESHETEMSLENLREEGPADSTESPDGSLSSEIFIVEYAAHEESTPSTRVLEHLEQVQQEDSNSYFVTPPGTPRRRSIQPLSPLNDLEDRRDKAVSASTSESVPQLSLQPRQPVKGVLPEKWPCHSPLPVWDIAANASESGEDTASACDSPNGIFKILTSNISTRI